MKKILIHIGYHKSGSTFLQQDVFPNLPVQFLFLSYDHFNALEPESYFDADAFRKKITQDIKEKYQQIKYETTILSHEQLSGAPNGSDIINPFVIAHNLKKAFPQAKILIIIRNQFAYIESIYTFRVAIKGAEYRTFKRYIAEEGKVGLFKHIEYHQLIEYYVKLFGIKQILVLPLEYLKADPNSFLNQITEFINLPEKINFSKVPKRNVSTKLVYILAIWRPINFVFHHSLLAIRFLFAENHIDIDEFMSHKPVKRVRFAYYNVKRFSTRIMNKLLKGTKRIYAKENPEYHQLKKRFEKSNDHLNEIVEIDLKKYNYQSN